MQDTGFHKINILFEEHWAHITTDSCLMGFLEQPGTGSMELAAYILKRYRELFECELRISAESLAVEILIHAYLDVFLKNTMVIRKMLPERLSTPLLKLTGALHRKTEVIDCGEKSVDNNRFVFDGLVPFHQLIFAMLDEPDAAAPLHPEKFTPPQSS